MESNKSSPVALVALLLSQTLAAFNENAAKFVLIALALVPGVLAAGQVDTFVALVPAALALPFLVFSPLAAWLADRHSKRAVLHAALALQVLVLAGLAMALYLQQVWWALFGFLLLATQNALFSPAKRGILRELAGREGLTRGVVWQELLTLGGILGGCYAGGRWFDAFFAREGDAFAAAFAVAVALAVSGVVALIVFQPVTHTPRRTEEPFAPELLGRQYNHLVELWRSRRLRGAALGILFFYFFGGVATLALIQAGREALGGGPGTVSLIVSLLLPAGVGVVMGNLAAGAVSRARVEIGAVPLGAAGMALSALYLGVVDPVTPGRTVALALLGFGGGAYLAPLYIYFQNRVSEGRRTRMLGALNLFRALGGLAAAGAFWGMTAGLGLTAAQQFLALTVPAVAAAAVAVWLAPEQLLLLVARGLAALFYRIRIRGLGNLPQSGALVISNHISYVDAVILQIAFPRKLWFFALHGPRRRGLPLWLYRISGVIPLSAARSSEGLRLAVRKMKEGELVCLFPEGQVSRTGALMNLRRGFEVLARRAEVPVVPVFIDSLWGSIFSYSNQKLFWKLPERLPFPVLVQVGEPLPPEGVNPVFARQALLDLGEVAYQQRDELRSHLGRECVRSLARHPWKTIFVDRTAERRVLSAGKLLAVAATYAGLLRREVKARRVGIVLPPGAGGAVANLAVVLAGKIPVNLNFTAGRAAIESSYRQGAIDTLISAEAVKQKVPQFPWLDNTRDIRRDLLGMGKLGILGRLILVWLLPSRLLSALWGVPRVGDREEAGLLFTSGSSGEPKGVALSHRNIIGNCGQISATGILPKAETLLACLPIFHSFGFTVTLWYPMLRGIRAVTVPSPLDTKKIIEVIEQEKVTIMVGAPTFIRPILKKAEAPQLASLRFGITGAEKLPVDLYEAFLQKFGVHLYQGYGLTETTPVVSVNIPDPPDLPAGVRPQEGHRLGSVGRLVAGMTARIADPDTEEPLPPNRTGMLWLRGPNVFAGYLHDPGKTAEAFRDGWFVTGDLARFDDDGFLYIEGRLSRFSKVGGEMVPHLTVEAKLVEAFEREAAEVQEFVVMGVPDATKGETLVLLTTLDLDPAVVREKLAALGLPNLWIPRAVYRVEQIPMLGTGKTDLKGCRTLAVELTGGGG